MPSVPFFQPNPFLSGNAISTTPATASLGDTLQAPDPKTTQGANPNQTQTYASTAMSPISLAFGASLNPTELLTKARTGTEALTPRQASQLDQLATGLGFPNGQTLTHALRHLPPESVQQWQAILPTQMPSAQQCSEAFQVAEQALSELANSQIETLFADLDLPAPIFRVERGSQWGASAYLAVLNNFKTMQAELPQAVLQEVGTGKNNKPLEFVRRDHPRPLTNPRSFMEVLSNSMKIAHTDADNKIYLYDAAVSMDPQDILNAPDLQDYVAKINGQPPSEAHVRSLQEMLNASLPASKQIETDGQMNAGTWAALSDFDTDQFLKTAEDILRDDSQLPGAERLQLQSKIDQLRREIAEPNPDNDLASVQLIDQLVDALGANQSLSPAGRRRVDALTQQHKLGTCANYLKQEQVERLVSNWLGIIDGGNQLDFTEQVINHELGHVFQERWLGDWSQISFQNFEQTPEAAREFMRATLGDHNHHDGHAHAHEHETGFGSDYARVNPEEDFAESFRLFTRHPEQLLEQNLLKFMFMAGATGAYADREADLVTLAKEQGYSVADIQAATRTLRGQTQEHHVQNVDRVVEKGLNWFNDTWMASGLRMFGYERGQDVRQNLVGAAASNAAHDNSPQFNLTSATLLPGLEANLGMSETASRAILPSQEGYLMTWLGDQAAPLYAPNATAAEREAAQQSLERFWSDGIAALPENARQGLTRSQQERAESPESRAMMMALAHLESMGQVMRGLAQKNNDSSQTSLNDLNSVLTEISNPETMAEALRETIGAKAFEQLPRSFLSYLSGPETLSQITGQTGGARLGSAVAWRSAEQAVNQRESLFQSAMKEVTDLSSNLMLSLSHLAFEENAQGQTVVNPTEKETMLEMMHQLFDNLSAARPELQARPNSAQLERMLETMAQRIQEKKSTEIGPESLGASDLSPQMLEEIQSTLLQNLIDLNQLKNSSERLMSPLEAIRTIS